MKVSGFTIIRNAVRNDYPVAESIRSLLPLVDELVVLIGDCEDDTEALIRSIGSDKIKIHHSTWDPAYFQHGRILAVETDKAFRLIDPESDWAFYLQADELIHEQFYPAIRAGMEKYKDDQRVEGLLFRYLHFYGTYDYVGDSRKWYNHEIRIIRNNKAIHSYRDAQGFRIDGRKLNVKPIDAWIYHYGWVKSPRQMMLKNQQFVEFWSEQEALKEAWSQMEVFDYSQFDSLRTFTGTHPSSMKERIDRQHWKVDFDISRKKFDWKGRLLYWIEQKTGKRLFDYKNYRIIP